jgi:peroxiredoxin
MKIVFQLLLVFGLVAHINAQTSGYKIGDKAEDFSLLSVDGNHYSMSDFDGATGFIIIFSCNHCPFVVKYEDRMIDIANIWVERGWVMLAINPNDPEVVPADSYEMMQVRAEEKGFPFPYMIDEGQKVYPKFGATRTPQVFLLDKDRVVRYIGAIDDNVDNPDAVEVRYLENAMIAIEEGKNPDPDMTRAIGCTIKVKK